MATRKRSIYATTSYFHGTDLYDNVQDPLKWIEVMWRQENNPEVVMSPVWKKLPWDLQVMVIEELYEVSAQRCYQIWDCLHDGTLE